MGAPLRVPALILAADHRARGIVTVERYDQLTAALTAALPHADGILATTQPLRDLVGAEAVTDRHSTYLSINRTGLAGSAFELDDRLVATVGQAKRAGYTGIKHMVRIDRSDPLTAPALELLGRVLADCHEVGVEALIEPLTWHDGAMARDVESIVYAAVIAYDLGAPIIKVPVPEAASSAERRRDIERIVASVNAPVLFLGGPREETTPDRLLEVVADVMAAGGAGMALGRAVYQDPDPAGLARAVAEVVHGR